MEVFQRGKTFFCKMCVITFSIILLASCSASQSASQSSSNPVKGTEFAPKVTSVTYGCTISPSLTLNCPESFSREELLETEEYLKLQVLVTNNSDHNLVYQPVPGFATLILAETKEGTVNPRLLSETHDFIMIEEVEFAELNNESTYSWEFVSEKPESLDKNCFASLLLVVYLDGEYKKVSSNSIMIK